MRFFVGLAVAFLVCLSSAQDYIERWRTITSGNLLEKVTFGRPIADPADNALVAGLVFPSQTALNPRQLIAAKFSANGDEVWSTRSDIGDFASIRTTGVDGAGNFYVLFRDPNTSGLARVRSFSGVDGSFRWERSFTASFSSNARSGVDLAVRTAGNSTFIYVAVSEVNNTIRLTRLNPSTGDSLFTAIINGSLSGSLDQNLLVDGNGNVYMLFKNADLIVTKRNQSLSLIWNRVLQGTFDTGFNLNAKSGEIAAMSVPDASSAVLLEILDPINGSLRRSVAGLPRVADGFSFASINGHSTGAWTYVAKDAFGARVQRVLSPNLKEQFARDFQYGALAFDSSGMGHGTQFDRAPVVTSYPRFGTHDLGLAEARGSVIGFDSRDRLLVSVNDNGKAVIIQLEQKFLAGTDIFAEPFTGNLDVEAPGVLANDTLSKGGVLSVVSNTTKGSLTLDQDGGFHYVPGANFDGNDQFQYRLTKGGVSRTASCFIKRLRIASISFDPTTIIASERGTTAKVTLTTGAFNLPVELSVSANPASSLINFPRVLTFRPGQVSQDLTVFAPPVDSGVNVSIQATLAGQTKSGILTLLPGAFNTIGVVGGAPAQEGLPARLRLSLKTPCEVARTFPLQYAGDVILSGPSAVTVPTGGSSVDFTVNVPAGSQNKQARILVDTGSSPGVFRLAFVDIKARPHLTSAGPVVTPIYAGFQNRYAVAVDIPAGSLAIPVVSESDNAAVTMPTVNVPAGQTTGSSAFTAPLTAANQTVTVTSRLSTDSISTTFLIRPNLLDTFAISPNTIGPFGSTTGRVTFNWVAPAGGTVVQVSTSTPTLCIVPSEVTMAAGRTVLTFPIAGRGKGGNAKVTVKVGLKTITKSFTITSP